MPISDIQLVFQWWSVLFLVGVAAFPLTKRLFSSWYDRGYFFSKAVGFAVVSYIVFLLGTLRIAPFSPFTILVAMLTLFILGIVLSDRTYKTHWTNMAKGAVQFFSFAKSDLAKLILCIALEEVVFFSALLFWSWVKAHEPAIRGLEKFMDYGFMQSILNSQYFPAPDMWWQGGFINYYYFGHLVTAVLTKLSGLDLSVTFNLMLATIFALTLMMSFSIGYQLTFVMPDLIRHLKDSGSEAGMTRRRVKAIIAGSLTAFLVTLAGNMQTIYAFTKGYIGDNVVPFWTILWSSSEFFSNVGEGMMRYWYANATRFIPFTIHEFPSYSFVVSDVHGHVLSIPFVLLAIALLVTLFAHHSNGRDNFQFSIFNFQSIFQITNYKFQIVFYGFLLGILLMTNALDGPIYFLLFLALFVTTKEIFNFQFSIFNQNSILNDQKTRIVFLTRFIPVIIVVSTLCITALPFLWHFKSFATGIGVNCPPEFLANTKIGPFLFEGVEKCQKSPLWMMELLWGFFWFTGIWLFIKRIWGKEEYDAPINRILKVFYIFGLVLIIIPEFFYVKDIYPAHFRSNTMFKLGYEAFILWSIVAGYVIVHFLFKRRQKAEGRDALRTLFFVLLFPQLFLVSIYPIFSTRSYFGELKTYRGIYGLEWLEKEYPDDWKVMIWIKSQIPNLNDQKSQLPVIVEADGDSYTDYNHVSAFAGVPTVVGWAVHEWLWRGSYDVVAPRREDVKTIYESGDVNAVRSILDTYNVRYVLLGKLEREKFKNIREDVIAKIGSVAFQSRGTVVYDVGEYKEVGY